MPLAFVAQQFDHPAVAKMQFSGTIWQGRIYPPGITDLVELSWNWGSLFKGKPGFVLTFSTENTTLKADLSYAQEGWVVNDLSGVHQVNTARLPALFSGQAVGPLRFSADRLVLDSSDQMITVDLTVADQQWSGTAAFDGLEYRAVIEPPAQAGMSANLVIADRWPFSDQGAQWQLVK